MHGGSMGVETRYGKEIVIMQEMGWSWTDLMDAPFDLVDEIGLRVSLRSKWEKEKRRADVALAQARKQSGR